MCVHIYTLEREFFLAENDMKWHESFYIKHHFYGVYSRISSTNHIHFNMYVHFNNWQTNPSSVLSSQQRSVEPSTTNLKIGTTVLLAILLVYNIIKLSLLSEKSQRVNLLPYIQFWWSATTIYCLFESCFASLPPNWIHF